MDKKDNGLPGIFVFIGYVAVISIAFGISMQSAFWGLIGIGVVLFLAGVVFLLIKAGIVFISDEIEYRSSRPPKVKEVKAKEAKIVKKKVKHEVPTWKLIVRIALFLLWAASPIVIFMILEGCFGVFAAQNPLAVIIMMFTPLITPLVVRGINKRRTKRKH